MNINSTTMSGRVTADAELKYSQKEMAICNFRIAVNDRRSDHTNFINVVCFGKQAETLNEYLVKGRLVGVTGRLEIKPYEKDGVKRDSISIIAEDIQLGPKAQVKEQEAVEV